MAREGHMPSMPGGLPCPSISLQYSRRDIASCSMPAGRRSSTRRPQGYLIQIKPPNAGQCTDFALQEEKAFG